MAALFQEKAKAGKGLFMRKVSKVKKTSAIIVVSVFFILVSIFLLAGCADKKWVDGQALSDAQTQNLANTQSGCQIAFTKTGMCASMTWQTEIQELIWGNFNLSFWNLKSSSNNRQLIDPPGNTVDIKLVMVGMAHKNAPPDVKRTGPGQFAVTRIYFTMPDQWQIVFTLKQDGQVLDQAIYNVLVKN